MMKFNTTFIFLMSCVICALTSDAQASSEGSCGKRKNNFADLIHRGEETDPYDWPWLAAVFSKKPKGLIFQCGGTLVSRNIVLTAAHCVHTSYIKMQTTQILVYLGRHNLLGWGEYDDSQARTVSTIIEHPDFFEDNWNKDSDLAVLVLNKEVEFNRKVQPICLLDVSVNQTAPGLLGTVLGWGHDEHSNILQEPKLVLAPVVSHEICNASHPDIHILLSDRTFCAGFKNGSGPCHGDSGGGMFVKYNDRWHLQGVVFKSVIDTSQSTPKACTNFHYSVYTDMVKFTPWLREQIQKYQVVRDIDLKRKDSEAGHSLDKIALECSAKLPGIRERYEAALSDAIASYNLTHKNFHKCESDLLHMQHECEKRVMQLASSQDRIVQLQEDNIKLLAAIDDLKSQMLGRTMKKNNLQMIKIGNDFYSYVNQTMTWFDAQKYCNNNGLALFHLRSKQQAELLRQYLIKEEVGFQQYWTAGTDAGTEGRFYWSQLTEPFKYTPWHVGEPNNNNGNEDCVELNMHGDTHQFILNDDYCFREYASLCELPRTNWIQPL